MSNTIKGFKTLSGEAYYDYNYLKNQPVIPSRLSELENDENYIDGAYVLDNSLFLTSNGRVVEGPLGPFAQGGEGGGGLIETDPTVPSWAKQPSKPTYTASEVGAEKTGAISTHNTASNAHNDIRVLINELTNRLNTLANSDDATLDQMKEVADYIKSNKTLIESVTEAKVNVVDIVNNLTSNIANKPLSAAQGVVLKTMIEEIVNDDKGLGISSITQTTTSTADNGINIITITFTDGSVSTFQVRNGSTGSVGPTGNPGYTPVRGKDYWTTDDRNEIVSQTEAMLISKDIPVFETFPTEEQINALPTSVSRFRTKGFHSANDGLGCVYRILNNTTAKSPYIPYGNKSFCPAILDANCRDIFVDYYGIRRYGDSTYAEKNSEIMNKLVDDLPNGYTLQFGSGHYYFVDPITCPNHTILRGTATNASVANEAVNYGAYLHFPNLSDGQAAITLKGGVVQDLGIMGNSSVCNVSLNRDVSITDRDNVVQEINGGTTYGIKIGTWGFTVQNVRIRYCSYGIYAETSNGLISHVDAHNCRIGISIGNDIKIDTVQLWNVITGIQLRGQLASAVNIRGDSIGKHLIECWRGKCNLSNIDGDYCVGSLIHYGDGQTRFMHLGKADSCMGRVATRNAYARGDTFDLRVIADTEYEYCSYISIAPNTQVFGGHIELTNMKANIFDVSSNYIHTDTPISIGKGSTVKGVTIKCNVPYDIDLDYFNRCVIKNLSTHNQFINDEAQYETDFDGNVIEDINFITPVGFIRSMRTNTDKNRHLEFSKEPIGMVRYDEQTLTDTQKLQARKNIGLDDISSIEFVTSIEDCVDGNKTYILSDGRAIAGKTEVVRHYVNQIPISIDATGSVYNASETPGYRLAYFVNGDQEAIPTSTTWYLTGYIPVNIGDIVRFENVEVMDMTANTGFKTCFRFYDEKFNFIIVSDTYHPGNLPSAAWSAQYFDNGDISQIKIPTAYTATIRYMRMCVSDINSESIITVNQEIKPPSISSSFGDTGLRLITDEMYAKLLEALPVIEGKDGVGISSIKQTTASTSDGGSELSTEWKNHLDTRIEDIRIAMETAGSNKSAFLWYTDGHWTYGSKTFPMVLKYLYENTAMTKTNFGGDIVDGDVTSSSSNASAYREKKTYLYEWRKAIRDIPNHHSVRGNHDDDAFGLYDASGKQNTKPIYAFLMAAEETPNIVRGSDMYYYIDESSEKTRYLYLDTYMCTDNSDHVGDPEMVRFVVDTLNSVQAGWHIVAISHIWWLYNDTNNITTGAFPAYCKQLLDIFDAYNARRSGSVTVQKTSTSVSYNFTSGAGKVEFCIGGHTHADQDFTSTEGIPVILTETASYHVRSGLACEAGKISETSVSGIIADYDNKYVRIIRVGRGSSRIIPLKI